MACYQLSLASWLAAYSMSASRPAPSKPGGRLAEPCVRCQPPADRPERVLITAEHLVHATDDVVHDHGLDLGELKPGVKTLALVLDCQRRDAGNSCSVTTPARMTCWVIESTRKSAAASSAIDGCANAILALRYTG